MNKTFDVSTILRLDKFLADKLNVSRNQIENAIKAELVFIDNMIAKKSGTMLKIGQIVTFHEPQAIISKPQEIDFDIDILFEDDDLMILNKPYNLTVHPAPSVKESTLVDWLKTKNISLSTLSGEERHGIVHRLDKGTSGAIAIAKNNLTHQSLSSQLEDKSMGRYYLAIIDLPLKENCIVEKSIGRNQNNRLKMDINSNGRYAKTAFTKISTSKNGKFELIAAKLFTGRTHQIRVHLQSLHRHIIGDSLYGFKGEMNKIDRIFLHAYCMYLEHPTKKVRLECEAPLKEDMFKFLNNNFDTEDISEKLNKNFIISCFNSIS